MPLRPDTVIIVLMVVDKCNLRCSHCFKSNRSGAELSPETARTAIRGFRRLFGSIHVGISGGEPSLHSRLDQIVSVAEAEGDTYHLVTNGWLFREVTLPLLLRCRKGLDCVAFSLEAADEAVHDRIRGKGSYARVIEALHLCREHRIGTRICCTLTRQNMNQVDGLVRLARSQCLSHGLFLWPAIPTRQLAERDELLHAGDLRYLAQKAQMLTDGVTIIGDLGPVAGPHDTCDALDLRQFTVTADGELSLCCNLTHYAGEPDMKDVIGPIRAGNLTDLVQTHVEMSAAYRKALVRDFARGAMGGPIGYACAHCARYHGKLDWLGDGQAGRHELCSHSLRGGAP